MQIQNIVISINFHIIIIFNIYIHSWNRKNVSSSELDTRWVYPNQIIILISRQTKFDEFWLRSIVSTFVQVVSHIVTINYTRGKNSDPLPSRDSKFSIWKNLFVLFPSVLAFPSYHNRERKLDVHDRVRIRKKKRKKKKNRMGETCAAARINSSFVR